MNESAKRGRSPIMAVFTTVFIDMLGFGILIPVYPLLISPGSPYKVTPDGWSFTEGLIMLGWLQGIFPLCIFLAAPILGQMSDRWGRRPVLAISIFGTAVGYALFALGIHTANLPLLFASRALDGITGGNQAVAQAAIADVSTPENRAKNFGVIGAAFGLGFIIGPYLGGRLSGPGKDFYGLFTTPGWFGATTPFLFAAVISLINCAQILLVLPETLATKDSTRRLQLNQSFSNIVAGFRSPRLRTVLATAFLYAAGFTFFTTFFGVFLRNNFGFDEGKTGDYFAIVGLFIAFSQAVLVGRIARRLVDWKVLRFSLFGTGAMILVFFASPTSTTFWLYAVIPVLALFQGLSISNTTSLVSRSAEMGRQGEAMGIYSSVSSLAQVPASVLVGYITGSIGSATPLLVAGSCIIAGGLLFVTVFRPRYVGEMIPGSAPAAH